MLLILSALAALRLRKRRVATCFALAGLLYVAGAMVPTMTVNVPLNEALALVETPLDPAGAREAWRNYSGAWQFWNTIRAVLAGFVLALAGWGSPEHRRRRSCAGPREPPARKPESPIVAAPLTGRVERFMVRYEHSDL